VPGGFFSSGFGQRTDPFTGSRSFHEGVDICAPIGTPVLATADGIVKFASRHAGYGLTLGIDHGRGITTWYAHVGAIRVINGQSVKRDQVVATVGTSGRVTAPHVHYEVRTNLKPVDPSQYMLPANVVVD
jgi:murein DD-endopeptidase MepM/ murein hydrolase activator NlpD